VRTIFVFALLVGFVASSALADDDLRPNGIWWFEMSSTAQLAAVIGAISAYEEAYAAGQLSMPVDKSKGYPYPRSPGFPHTYGYYSEAVTDFYTLHPDLKLRELGVVLECLSDQPPPHSVVPCP
jgi:hypothetical protein